MVSSGKSAWVAHAVLLLGLAVVLFPVYVAFVASSLPLADILDAPMTLFPGPDLVANYRNALARGTAGTNAQPVAAMILSSLVMALAIAIGKIAISLPSAYAVVFFRFPLRRLCFWAIFVTLMLPVEVRIIHLWLEPISLAVARYQQPGDDDDHHRDPPDDRQWRRADRMALGHGDRTTGTIAADRGRAGRAALVREGPDRAGKVMRERPSASAPGSTVGQQSIAMAPQPGAWRRASRG